MTRFLLIAMVSLMLTACGRGGEDFTVKVDRPAERVAAAFSQASVDSEIGALLPGLKVVRSQPKPDTVIYTIPGDGSFETIVKLTFAGSADGKATVIHGAIDVPSTEVTFDGKQMVISESKVERIVAGILRSAARKLEKGEDIANEQRDFSRMLTVLAIITDSKKLQLAQDISKYPEWYMAGLGWLSGADDGVDNPYGDFPVGEDPTINARQDEYRQQRAESEEKAKADQASEPMDAAAGDSAGGDYSGGSDE
ncbi:MAG: hypothetical protein J0M19_04410 [Sphingomonadales bacterium]|nr:hypothetical protein [Sphingomonadales bacterium]